MAERGVENDLDLLQDVKKALPYSSENIERLLEIVERQIKERLEMSEQQIRERLETKITNPEEKVFAALSEPKWDFRTIPGISRETGLSESTIREILNEHPDQVRKSLVRNQNGYELFTSRNKPIKIRERLAVIQKILSTPFV